MRHHGGDLQVQLARQGLDGRDLGHRRESVEDGDLEVAALESHRVGDRIAVHADLGDC
jgi:hypothetical protein